MKGVWLKLTKPLFLLKLCSLILLENSHLNSIKKNNLLLLRNYKKTNQ